MVSPSLWIVVGYAAGASRRTLEERGFASASECLTTGPRAVEPMALES